MAMEIPKLELERARQIAVEAGEILSSYAATGGLDVRAKGDRDVVTAADLASEERITARLRQLFPGDAIVGEEGGERGGAVERRWYVDPLDGTLNYSRGLPIWCVSLSLFQGVDPRLGVIHDPLRAETFVAERGEGAYCNGSPIRCSEVSSLSAAVVHLTTDVESDGQHSGLEDLMRLHGLALRTRNIGSAALGLAYVAAGRLDAMIHRRANTWDFGAGVLLVQEAGGIVTAVDGSPYTDRTHSIVAAANQDLHRAVLDLLRMPRAS